MKSKKPLSSLSILIPAYNDEDTIEDAVREARDVARKVSQKYEIRVIDDVSQDNTFEILQKLQKKIPALVVRRQKKNKGYGGTIKDLYYEGEYEWLFTVPGDYQIGAKELLTLVKYKDKADMIIGWRKERNDPHERLRQSKIYNTLLTFMFMITIHDVNSVRLMKQEIMEHITLTTSSAFVDAELVIRAKKAGYKVKEAVIKHRKRKGREESAGGGKVRTIIPTIFDMARFYVLRK